MSKKSITTTEQAAKWMTDEERAAFTAEIAVEGLAHNGRLLQAYGEKGCGRLDTTHVAEHLIRATREIEGGDMERAERLLFCQAVSLNAVFSNYALQAAEAEYVDQAERLLRLALRAQSQSRMTLETLATIKNPLNGAYVRQANLAGGHQQINNGNPPARTPEGDPAQIEQSRGLFDGKQLDRGTQKAASRGHQEVAAVGEIHRAKDSGRKAAGIKKRRQGRRVAP